MYKLFINNIQIGNYRNMKSMFESALNIKVISAGVQSMKWVGNTLYITTYHWGN